MYILETLINIWWIERHLNLLKLIQLLKFLWRNTRRSHQLVENPDADFNVEDYKKYVNLAVGFVIMRDGCINEAIWLFSFRYWSISFVMPW